MSKQTKAPNSNVTIKYSDVVTKQIFVEPVKMGQDSVPLLKYGPEKSVLFIQGPWIKMAQFGLPPGETLSNGDANEFYTGDDARLSIRFPLDVKCCVQTDPSDADKTNKDDILAFIAKLQEIDSHIKNTPEFLQLGGVDQDDKEKYTPIYRKPAKPKKVSKEPKEKFYSMKAKLDTVGESNKKIKTEFFEVDRENPKNVTPINPDGCVALEDLEKLITFNSEVLPIIQLVKIWTQSTGAWGITLKLKKARVKRPNHTAKANAEFLDSDEESDNTEPIKQVTQNQTFAPKHTVQKTVVNEENSDQESEQESDQEVVQPVVSSHSTLTTKGKQVAQVESESESDEEVKPVKISTQSKTPVKATAKPSTTKPKKAAI